MLKKLMIERENEKLKHDSTIETVNKSKNHILE